DPPPGRRGAGAILPLLRDRPDGARTGARDRERLFAAADRLLDPLLRGRSAGEDGDSGTSAPPLSELWRRERAIPTLAPCRRPPFPRRTRCSGCWMVCRSTSASTWRSRGPS